MASLTDTKARNAKPTDKPYQLQDGQGLYLDVRASGSKFWRYRYWITPKKAGIYTIGEYPAVSLSEARKEREWAREQAKQGMNPTDVKKIERLGKMDENANTFESVAREWIAENKKHWSERYAKQVEDNLEKDVFPTIGAYPIRMVKASHLLEIIKKVDKRGAGTIAVLIRQWSSHIFRYAIPNQKAEFDPAASLDGALKRKPVRHNPPLSKSEIPVFIKKLDGYGGYLGTKISIRLMMLTFVRTQELRLAEWKEFDLDAAEWRIPAVRMKMAKHMKPGEVHIVPLARQAVAMLRELHTISGGRDHLFPNLRTPKSCMTSTTINRVLERLGYLGQFSGHGFRTTASTMLHEIGFRSEVIEKQMAHAERNKVKAAYNHAEYLPERREMMQAWADWIDGLVVKATASRTDSEASATTASADAN
jgi:integrase